MPLTIGVQTDELGEIEIDLDVPGNEDLMSEVLDAQADKTVLRRAPTDDEIQRAVRAHLSRLAVRDEAALGAVEDAYEARPDLQEMTRRGDHVYLDSRNGEIREAPAAPDPLSWYRIVFAGHEADDAFEAGEFPIIAHPSVLDRDPGDRTRLLEAMRFSQYEPGDSEMRPKALRMLRERYGINRPDDPAGIAPGYPSTYTETWPEPAPAPPPPQLPKRESRAPMNFEVRAGQQPIAPATAIPAPTAMPPTFTPFDVDAGKVFGRAWDSALTDDERAFLRASSPDRPVNLMVLPPQLRLAHAANIHGRAKVGEGKYDSLVAYSDANRLGLPLVANHELGHLTADRLLAGDMSGMARSAVEELRAEAAKNPGFRSSLTGLHPGTASVFEGPLPEGPQASPGLHEVLAMMYEAPVGGQWRLPESPLLRDLRRRVGSLATYYTQGP